MKLLQQTPLQQGSGAGGSGWAGASSGMAKSGKPPALTLLEMHQEAERILKQQRVQQQRDRVSTGEDVHTRTRPCSRFNRANKVNCLSVSSLQCLHLSSSIKIDF